MKRLASLIIDDERLARVSLRKKLAIFQQIEVVGEASSIASAIKAINELKPDLLFLDIQLSDGSGFDLLEKIEFSGKVVFVTAYDEYALRAFEVNAVDYLLKPVSNTRLKSLISKISSPEKSEGLHSYQRFLYSDRIMIEQKGYLHFLLIKDIVMITSAKDYSIITTFDHKKFIVLSSMNDWEIKLPDDHFYRAHRSNIINLNFIEKTIRVGSTAEIYMTNLPEPIKVSRNYYKILREKYFYK
ncbi:MAG: LytTR family DNA-binding domain-containing protein [Bacteroidetes bacterium]|nr:LytTR family DNA-binding domain-containing protein [Bacteroidota bacterium]